MIKHMNFRRILSAVLLLHLSMIPLGRAGAEEQARPAWWEQVSVQMPRMERAVRQYFYIRENFLEPAYRAQGPERELLLKRSIKACALLIEWFTDKKHMPTAVMTQYLMADAYRQLGDIEMAKQSYRLCLDYQKYVGDPITQQGELSIMAVVESAKAKLESLS